MKLSWESCLEHLSCVAACSPFAAKLGIGVREGPQGQGVELSRTTSLRHYGAIKNPDDASVEDILLWSAVRPPQPCTGGMPPAFHLDFSRRQESVKGGGIQHSDNANVEDINTGRL